MQREITPLQGEKKVVLRQTLRAVSRLAGSGMWVTIRLPGEKGTLEEQRRNLQTACEGIAAVMSVGYSAVVTQGNGPQVGDALARSELTGSQMEPLPMDACVAETQGSIGSLLQQALQKTLQRHGLSRPVVTIVTQVLISPRDPALRNLTKPVGPLYNQTACPAKLRNWAATIGTRGLPRKARQ